MLRNELARVFGLSGYKVRLLLHGAGVEGKPGLGYPDWAYSLLRAMLDDDGGLWKVSVMDSEGRMRVVKCSMTLCAARSLVKSVIAGGGQARLSPNVFSFGGPL